MASNNKKHKTAFKPGTLYCLDCPCIWTSNPEKSGRFGWPEQSTMFLYLGHYGVSGLESFNFRGISGNRVVYLPKAVEDSSHDLRLFVPVELEKRVAYEHFITAQSPDMPRYITAVWNYHAWNLGK
jgi:hypothetical protein